MSHHDKKKKLVSPPKRGADEGDPGGGGGGPYQDHYVTIQMERTDIRPVNYFLMPRGTDGNVCVIKAVPLIKLLDN